MLTRSYVDVTIYRLHDRSLDLPLCHDLVTNSNAAGPVVTIGTVDVSGGSHNATVGQSLVLSCNTAAAQWKKGSVTITSTNTMSRVYVISISSATILMVSPFQTTDAGMYTCEYNSTYKTSVTLSEWRCFWLAGSMVSNQCYRPLPHLHSISDHLWIGDVASRCVLLCVHRCTWVSLFILLILNQCMQPSFQVRQNGSILHPKIVLMYTYCNIAPDGLPASPTLYHDGIIHVLPLLHAKMGCPNGCWRIACIRVNGKCSCHHCMKAL